MRPFALALVVIGALTLGVSGFGISLGDWAGAADPFPRAGAFTLNAPALGGIAVVIGLLLLAGGGRRD